MTDEALVLGLDVGGTSTRVLAVTPHGLRRGAGRASGGNPTGLGPERAAAALAEAVAQALTGLDPADVRHVVLGLAGGGALPSGEDMPGGEAFTRVWDQTGIRCPIEYEPDALIAFAAGTAAAEGSLLLSGTGAVAIAVKDRTMAARADGHGWLLGDRGSGFWLGRQAVLAAMAELDGEGPATVLTDLVIESLRLRGSSPVAGPASGADAGADTPLTAREMVAAVMSEPPTALARLAPLLTAACEGGDAVAKAIADRAVEHLAATLTTVRGPDATSPIVLAGSVLTNPTPVAERVRRMLRERWPDAEVSRALDGAAAAAWLALARIGPMPSPDVRERLFSIPTAS
ncbi:ATPase BadF/BadG/BcrA/BcrD type [Catenulispora acidiphila DSM 44928]|uniref:ATPase BadF/BadG/BcrA/BcrD type n=1 Tax=Catenulispora acidiphila (strain DSM 44928 / JCM 14897 / NBRC 102108 / NRRL B-24433 / ID139908) TaxID=479433 RepID=C7QEH1_CATAD|nr:BadF/BadG/BcrA/BcrD ATPase family protein [Catenulispora acidiphila]ACU70862.1 ATPase BadF/BadG/BcrA/BcrD type [Catenulispora acidiphila DSM 44928]